MAMVEIGYRYQELYLAGMNENWDYATYQVKKIRQSLENALERRPRREASARNGFFPALDAMAEAVAGRDRERFTTRFDKFTDACNRCHVAEAVPSFVVTPPERYTSPIR